jgi:hypothetical protein
MEEPEGEAADEDPIDDLGQALHDAHEDCENKKERINFQWMFEDHRKLLYPCYEDGLKKLVALWSYCNGRQHMEYPTKDLVNY